MKNNGGDTDYYKIKPEWKMAQDIIEDRQMNYAQGNIFKVAYCFNKGRHDATDYLRELNKLSWFIEREKNKINLQHSIDNKQDGNIIYQDEVDELLGGDEYDMTEYDEYKKLRQEIESHLKDLNLKYKLGLTFSHNEYCIIKNKTKEVYITTNIKDIKAFLVGFDMGVYTYINNDVLKNKQSKNCADYQSNEY